MTSGEGVERERGGGVEREWRGSEEGVESEWRGSGEGVGWEWRMGTLLILCVSHCAVVVRPQLSTYAIETNESRTQMGTYHYWWYTTSPLPPPPPTLP